MCGIAGIINFSEELVSSSQIESMLGAIKHRGPDDSGIYIDKNVGVGHVRLSILDLSAAGHQPMKSNNGRYWICFNGEIYNYLELKSELINRYQFKSSTDTEVLLAAYITWGEACLHKLNGDFSFVIYDREQRVLFGARDRFGIKPFYYQIDNHQFVFGSEIKALLSLGKKRTQNDKIIFDYLLFNRTDQSEETFFSSILKLKHGHCFLIKNDHFQIKKWYHLGDKINYPSSMEPVQFRQELSQAISLRLRSDVPIGVCLSGGIDSSAITSILYRDFKQTDLKTFSAVFGSESKVDESSFIDAFKPVLSNMYSILPTSESFYSEFRDFISSQGEPVPGIGPYAQFKVMQLAKGKVSVTLDGQGADEMLGGYDYFYGCYFKELLNTASIMELGREMVACYKNNPQKGSFSYFAFYLAPTLLKNHLGRRNSSVSKQFFDQNVRGSTLTSDLYNPNTVHEFCLQHFEYKLEHLLKWDDLNSMRFSIESRVPFLDHHLVEKSLSLPTSQLMWRGTSKFILRESVKDILPAMIYNRKDKIGFGTPADEWLRSKPFSDFILTLINSIEFKERGYFDAKTCNERYALHLNLKLNIAKEIWKWINLELWFRTFIDPPSGGLSSKDENKYNRIPSKDIYIEMQNPV